MKKSTVLILIVIYLGSIFIVGVYGLKARAGNEVVYCEKITPTKITFSSGDVLTGDDIQFDEASNMYIAKISRKKYTDGLTVTIEYAFTPADFTYNTKEYIEIIDTTPVSEVPSPATIGSDGKIVFSRKDSFYVTFTVKDRGTGNAEMTICIAFGK